VVSNEKLFLNFLFKTEWAETTPIFFRLSNRKGYYKLLRECGISDKLSFVH
jgi:hypothetical protein